MKKDNLKDIKKMVDENFESINGRLVKKNNGDKYVFPVDHINMMLGRGIEEGELSINQYLNYVPTHKAMPFSLMLAKEKRNQGFTVVHISLENTPDGF
jgi:hypothetical protein